MRDKRWWVEIIDRLEFPLLGSYDLNATYKNHGFLTVVFFVFFIHTILTDCPNLVDHYKVAGLGSISHLNPTRDSQSRPPALLPPRTTFFFMSIYAVFKLECLKIRHKTNHFAMRAKLLLKPNQLAYEELQKLRAA